MDTQKTINITTDLLDNLESSSGIINLTTEDAFLEVIKRDRVIIYFLVDWSGPERISRYYVYKALNDIDKTGTPVFKIDCTDQTKKHVVDWLIGQRENKKHFYYGGWGETLLISKGDIVDFLGNPGQLGYEKTKQKLEEWK
jgi:hypothetical protein